MKMHLRRYAWSFVIALIVTVLVGAVASIPKLSAVGVLLAPGMLAGAIVFPEGTKSNWPGTYLVIAALMNAFFLSWLVWLFWVIIGRAHRRN